MVCVIKNIKIPPLINKNNQQQNNKRSPTNGIKYKYKYNSY